MDDRGHIREVTHEEPIKKNETSVSDWARKKLKKLPIRLRIKWRSLRQKGYNEKDSFSFLISQHNTKALEEPEYNL